MTTNNAKLKDELYRAARAVGLGLLAAPLFMWVESRSNEAGELFSEAPARANVASEFVFWTIASYWTWVGLYALIAAGYCWPLNGLSRRLRIFAGAGFVLIVVLAGALTTRILFWYSLRN